jgi:hypothetical protein
MLNTKAYTTGPVEESKDVTNIRPEWIRLPQPGLRCHWTGISRSALNQLILPGPANGGRPPVVSYCLRQKGKKTGIRLISYDSLRKHIEANQVDWQKEGK